MNNNGDEMDSVSLDWVNIVNEVILILLSIILL